MDAKERRLVDLLWRKTSLLSSEGICFLYEARGLGGQWVADGQSQSYSLSISLSRVKKNKQERAGSHGDMKLTHFGTRKGWGHTPFLQMGCWQLSPGTSPPSLLPSMVSSTPCCDMSSWAFMSLECSFSFCG